MSTKELSNDVSIEIDRYKKFMLEHEYTVQSTHKYCIHLSRFLQQLNQNEICFLQGNIRMFLKSQNENHPGSYKECRAALYLYFKIVTGERYPKHPTEKRNPEIEAIIERFYDHSINIKRIRQKSAEWEVTRIRRFLGYIKTDDQYWWENITAHDIRWYVVNHMVHLADSSKGHDITAIRNFFRFLKFEGVPVHGSIFLLPLSPAIWKNADAPVTMDKDIFSTLSEAPDKNTPTGKRDRCIVLCFTELALRCMEVSMLSIDDFHWRDGYVSIKNTKNHADRKLPVSKKLMQALVGYLMAARPKTSDRTLFVRFKHNCGEPMGCSQIRGVMRRIYKKCGVDKKVTGTHILRRTVGTKIYNSGNSLKMTADILGHESLDSTVFYIMADIVGLQQVAAPWLGAGLKAGDHDVE